jgi:hypothetical protein
LTKIDNLLILSVSTFFDKVGRSQKTLNPPAGGGVFWL